MMAPVFAALFFLCRVVFSNPNDVECPNDCDCSLDTKNHGHIVKCSSQEKATSFPQHIPADTKELHMDAYAVDVITLPPLPFLQTLTVNHCQASAIIPLDKATFPQLETLDLSHNNFTDIPCLQDTNVKVVHLNYNRVRKLNTCSSVVSSLRHIYLEHNLLTVVDIGTTFPNIKVLVLSHNNISAIDFLPSLPLLKELNLRNNSISELKAFSTHSSIQYLDLGNNSLTQVLDDTFRNLSSLVTLNLKHNQLASMPQGLPMLENLDLSYNHITRISEDRKYDVYPVQVFNIAHNPLHCDCDMLWLKELYDNREYLLKHLDIPVDQFIPSCLSPPSLADESWAHLGNALFGCDDEIGTAPGGRPNLVVKCGKVTGDRIEVHWSWSLKGRLAYNTVYIQYYVFGLRSETTKHIEVALIQRQFTLKNLRPLTNYVVCVVPREDHSSTEKPEPPQLDHCVEVATKEGEPIEVLSFFYIFTYYVLGMCATVIAIFAIIGLFALIYGVYSSKSDWSSKYVPIDEPQEEEEAETSNKPHND